jgi:uncharacterized protein (TIGR03435 family)
LWPQERLSFVVASVKIAPDDRDSPPEVRETKERVVYRGISLFHLIIRAFNVKWFQIEAPEWLRRVEYDVEALLPERASRTDIPGMLQTLLVERFNLRYHREQKETRIAVLTTDPSGIKFRKLEDVTNVFLGTTATIVTGRPGQELHIKTMSGLVDYLAGPLNRPVVDRTGLSGYYDIKFRVMGQPSAVASEEIFPDITTTIKELGLRLDQSRGQVEYLIIDMLTRHRVKTRRQEGANPAPRPHTPDDYFKTQT